MMCTLARRSPHTCDKKSRVRNAAKRPGQPKEANKTSTSSNAYERARTHTWLKFFLSLFFFFLASFSAASFAAFDAAANPGLAPVDDFFFP